MLHFPAKKTTVLKKEHYFLMGGMYGINVIGVVNEYIKPSSIPGWDCFYFTNNLYTILRFHLIIPIHLFSHSYMVSGIAIYNWIFIQIYLTNRWDFNRCYHFRSDWTKELWQWTGIPHSPQLQNWSFTIGCSLMSCSEQYHHRKQTQQFKFKSWTKPFLSKFMLMTLRKVWIHFFSF